MNQEKKHVNYLKTTIKDFTLNNLEEYCKNNNDDINRIILNATEILIDRYEFEFNLILNQLVNEELADNQEEIDKFKSMWIKKIDN